ncbi:MAG: hypothetical protein ACM3X3_07105 [Betaproteobacteria bacterium]
MTTDAWFRWRDFVTGVLDSGRPMTEDERRQADELVKQAKTDERRERRKQKRLARGGEWVEKPVPAMVQSTCGACGGAAPEQAKNRPRTPEEACSGLVAGGGPDQLAEDAGRPGFLRSRGSETAKWTPAAILAEQNGLLRHAQMERRNITIEEEKQYLALRRLRLLAEEFMEGHTDD